MSYGPCLSKSGKTLGFTLILLPSLFPYCSCRMLACSMQFVSQTAQGIHAASTSAERFKVMLHMIMCKLPEHAGAYGMDATAQIKTCHVRRQSVADASVYTPKTDMRCCLCCMPSFLVMEMDALSSPNNNGLLCSIVLSQELTWHLTQGPIKPLAVLQRIIAV